MRHRRWSAALAGLLTALTIASAAPVVAATPAPTGIWNFNGNLRNGAGTALKMTGINGPTFGTATIRGTQDRIIRIADTQGTRVTGIPLNGRRTFTIDVLLEFDEADGYSRILSFGPNDEDEALYLYDGYPYLYDEKWNEDIVIPANKWARIRVTRDGSTKVMRVYVNGTIAFRYTDVDNIFTLRNGTVVFFQDDSNASENGIGSMASVRIWNKVVVP